MTNLRKPCPPLIASSSPFYSKAAFTLYLLLRKAALLEMFFSTI
jgi:hypothetical protein